MRLTQAPAAAEDYHGPAPSSRRLDRVFRLEEPRVVANDWVVRYRNRVFQLERHSPLPPARGTVLVSEDATGLIEIRYRERVMPWTELPSPRPPTRPPSSPPASPPVPGSPARGTSRRPPADHPWARSQDFALMRDVAAVRRASVASHPHPGDISME